MDTDRLKQHIAHYQDFTRKEPQRHADQVEERRERKDYFRAWTRERLLAMSEGEFEEYLSKLWAMLIWGNKKYVTDKIINQHGLETVRKELAELVWGKPSVVTRWDRFRSKIKGMGPAMISEILSHVHSDSCMLWNRRAYVGLRYLGVEELPKYDYQLTGQRYEALSAITGTIVKELVASGFEDADLLTADYFIWEELQVESNLSALFKEEAAQPEVLLESNPDKQEAQFIHDEVRDKLKDIGQWLGLESRTEVKVADGSRVDTLWEQSIGNMGQVVYVFEVQTRGSIDSLILNLLKSVNNPGVQAVVAVSDTKQLDKIRKHAAGVQGLNDKLKYWDYRKVLEVHEALGSVNAEINSLGLVPNFQW